MSKRRKIKRENKGKWKYYTMVLRKKVEGSETVLLNRGKGKGLKRVRKQCWLTVVRERVNRGQGTVLVNRGKGKGLKRVRKQCWLIGAREQG
jgi:hypothetical protein